MDEIVQGATLLAEPKTSRETKVMPIRKIGIVGAGQMGSGIAHVVALSGYQAVINDLDLEHRDYGYYYYRQYGSYYGEKDRDATGA